jgi:hypothetical protein
LELSEAYKLLIEKLDGKNKELGLELMKAIFESSRNKDISSSEMRILWEMLWPKILS